MKTKLVYVLTCAPEATFVEQALMAVYSARYYNPNAYIVLIVDDLTDQLFTGSRAEILKHISEKLVVSFDDASLTPMYRSRWIKTSVRQLIEGDMIFIDCDTICQRPLNEIDTFECEVGAVPDSHLHIADFCESLMDTTTRRLTAIGMDVDKEEIYYSSGVIYAKDTPIAHKIYELWHAYWLQSCAIGMPNDQPSFAKANSDAGHPICTIPDSYNCIVFTQPPFMYEAHILHISSYRNPSFLYTERVLRFAKEVGMSNEWLCKMALHPCATIMPFDYNIKHSTCQGRRKWRRELADAWKGYGENIDKTFAEFPIQSRFSRVVKGLLRKKQYRLAMVVWMLWKRVRLRRKEVKYNVCAK